MIPNTYMEKKAYITFSYCYDSFVIVGQLSSFLTACHEGEGIKNGIF